MQILQKIEGLVYAEANHKDMEALQSQIVQVSLDAYGAYEQVLGLENANLLRSNISKPETWELLFSVARCFVCLQQEELTGCAFLIPSGNPWKFFESNWSYIRMLGVSPRCQGKGIGRQLTELCIAAARLSGEEIIALHTSEIMPAARHIYESMHFQQVRELEPHLGKKYFLYQLRLNP